MAVEAVFGDASLAWVSDIDPGACKVLAHRYPGVPNLGDMTTVDWAAVEPVDVLTGGTPCQDLSHAGKRAGMTEGTRSNLWVTMREAIAALRPSLVVWENVGGAYSAEADSELVRDPRLLAGTRRRDGEPVLRALGRVLGDLSSLGYVGGWHGLRAADVGAPHSRLRVFVVATPADDHRGRREVLPQLNRHPSPAAAHRGSCGGHADGHPGTTLLPSPRTSDTNGAGVHGDGGPDLRTVVATLPTPDWKDHEIRREPHRPDDVDTLARALTVTLLPTPLVGSTSEASHGQISGQYREQMADALRNWGQYAAAIARWEHLTRPAPPPTETGPKGNPRLSPRFTEWLMGMPDGWVTDVPGVTRNQALKLCGNGVVPQQAAAALRFLLPLITQERAA
jgi:DNA (cytosine-5)-methyltransferase 1